MERADVCGRKARSTVVVCRLLEDEFRAKLNDAGRDGSVGGSGLHAEGCRRQQAAAAGCEGILGCAHGEHIILVEDVKGLKDPLEFHALPEGNIVGDARVEADVPREIKRVATEARESSGAAKHSGEELSPDNVFALIEHRPPRFALGSFLCATRRNEFTLRSLRVP